MTLPASGAIDTDMILAELRTTNTGRPAPVTTDDADVRTLAGRSAGQSVNIPDDFWGKTATSGSTALTATGYSDTTSMASNATGLVYTGHAFPSVTAGGGTAPYTYAWSITGGSGFVLSKATSTTCDVAQTIGRAGYTGTCTLQCMVADSAGHNVTVSGIQAVYTAGTAQQSGSIGMLR